MCIYVCHYLYIEIINLVVFFSPTNILICFRFSLRRRVAMSLYLLVGYITVFSLQSNVSMAVVDITSNRIGTSENGKTVQVNYKNTF